MPEVSGIGGGGISPQNQNQVGDRSVAPVNQTNVQPTPIGQPGPLGQPTGLPAPVQPGQVGVMPDVLAGRDPSQMVAAERMRASGGASATDELLGLNRQPSMLGAFAPPPGNSEALRHMTPTMRRAVMRTLLEKQRERMLRLASTTRRERDHEEAGGEGRDDQFADDSSQNLPLLPLDAAQLERARHELNSTTRMLDLLAELLAMQDYVFSQMGTFSQG
jgi:hypothetical protein